MAHFDAFRGLIVFRRSTQPWITVPMEEVFMHTFKSYESDYQVEHSILIPDVLSFHAFQVGQSNNKTCRTL